MLFGAVATAENICGNLIVSPLHYGQVKKL
jgi:hypothetical protein